MTKWRVTRKCQATTRRPDTRKCPDMTKPQDTHKCRATIRFPAMRKLPDTIKQLR